MWARVIAHPWFAPELSPLAFDGDELVGAVLSHDYASESEGWIQQLATKATHRRRGIAQALLLTAFGWFFGAPVEGPPVSRRTRGPARSRLYEKVGMRVVRQYTRYTKQLS